MRNGYNGKILHVNLTTSANFRWKPLETISIGNTWAEVH